MSTQETFGSKPARVVEPESSLATDTLMGKDKPVSVTSATVELADPDDSDVVARAPATEPPGQPASSNDSGSSLMAVLIHYLFFLPNTVLLKPLGYVLFLLTYPIKMITYLLFYRIDPNNAWDTIPTGNQVSKPQKGKPSSPNLTSGNTPNLSPPSRRDSAALDDDIEIEVADKDDGIRSPTGASPLGPTAVARSSYQRPRRKKLIFPRMLFNFDISKPPNMPKKTLVLDLDETLIHSLSRRNSSILNKSTGATVEVKLNTTGLTQLYYIYKRPHVDEFLSLVRHWFNLVVFTASIQDYADPVINYLEEEVRLKDKAEATAGSNAKAPETNEAVFSQRFYRDSCIFIEGRGYVKDLSVLTGNRASRISPQLAPSPTNQSATPSPPASPLMLSEDTTPRSRSRSQSRSRSGRPTHTDYSKIIIIDNSPISYAHHRDNGIMIEGWINDPDDTELMTLIPLLKSLRFTSDVRCILGLKNGQAQFK